MNRRGIPHTLTMMADLLNTWNCVKTMFLSGSLLLLLFIGCNRFCNSSPIMRIDVYSYKTDSLALVSGIRARIYWYASGQACGWRASSLMVGVFGLHKSIDLSILFPLSIVGLPQLPSVLCLGLPSLTSIFFQNQRSQNKTPLFPWFLLILRENLLTRIAFAASSPYGWHAPLNDVGISFVDLSKNHPFSLAYRTCFFPSWIFFPHTNCLILHSNIF